MYVNLDEYILNLEQNSLTQMLSKVKEIQDRYPKTLRAYKDHYGSIRLCSSEVNIFCTHTEFFHRKEPREGTLELMPYIDDKGTHVYADPPIYSIGYTNPYGFGDIPLEDWEETLKDNDIPKEILRKVRTYFKGHAAVNYKDIPT